MNIVAFLSNQEEGTEHLLFLLESVRLGYKDCSSIVYEYRTQWVQVIFEGAFLFSCLRYFLNVHEISKQFIKLHCPMKSATYKIKVV